MTQDATTADYEFECPDCGERFEVNDGMRTALLERGCPICSAAVTERAFSSLSPP